MDLSTVNVICSLTVKVSDFGFSRLLPDDGRTMSQLGTPLYKAPEVTGHQGYYGTKVDLYSLGVIAYELATGQRQDLKIPLGMYCYLSKRLTLSAAATYPEKNWGGLGTTNIQLCTDKSTF